METEYFKVDPFTDEERSSIFSQVNTVDYNLQMKFVKFASEYQDHYDTRTKQIESHMDLKNGNVIRSSISVLIITGSVFKNNIYVENGREENFYENAEDLSTAFYICHLFHYVYGIPYQQLLITSTQQEQFNGSNHSFTFNNSNYGLFQNVVLAQVGNTQYKFFLEKWLLERFVPFNSDFIKEKLSISEQYTKLFVFILDHESVDRFGELEYDKIIYTLNQISCKHFYVFNDSCYSTSLIDLINTSYSFNEFFPELPEEDSAKLFQHFSNMTSINDADSDFFIINFRNYISQNFKIETKDKLLKYLQEVDIKKLISLINYISKYLPSFECIPKHIAQFREKSTIFAESIHGGNSITLPPRRIYAFIYKNYRSCVSIFSSIFIEAFLSKPITFDEFCQKIKDLFPKYKNNFIDIIIKQHKKTIEEEQSNEKKKKQLKEDEEEETPEEIINKFFEIDPLDENHMHKTNNSSSEWPKFGEIFEDKKDNWNVDSSEVDPIEYENVYINQLLKYKLSFPKNPDNYGPSKEERLIKKYLQDFAKEFNKKLKAKNLKEFSLPKRLFNASNSTKEKILNQMRGKGFHTWTAFFTKINPYIVDNLYKGLEFLKYPIIRYANNINDEKDIPDLLSETYNTLLPFWKDYRLNY